MKPEITIERALYQKIVETLIEAFHEARSYGPSEADQDYIQTIKDAKAILGETYWVVNNTFN